MGTTPALIMGGLRPLQWCVPLLLAASTLVIAAACSETQRDPNLPSTALTQTPLATTTASAIPSPSANQKATPKPNQSSFATQTVVVENIPIETPDNNLPSTPEAEAEVAPQLEPTQGPTPLAQPETIIQPTPTATPMPADQPLTSLQLATRPCHQVGDLIWVHRLDVGEDSSSPTVVEGVAYLGAKRWLRVCAGRSYRKENLAKRLSWFWRLQPE